MKILLADGKIVSVPAAKWMQEHNRGKELKCLGPRNRVFAVFVATNVVAWWWDNDDVSLEEAVKPEPAK